MYEAWTGVEPWGDIREENMSRESIVLMIARQRKPPTMAKEKWEEMSCEFKEFYKRVFEMVGEMTSGDDIQDETKRPSAVDLLNDMFLQDV